MVISPRLNPVPIAAAAATRATSQLLVASQPPPTDLTFRAPLVSFLALVGIGFVASAASLSMPSLTLHQLGASKYISTQSLLAVRAVFAATIGVSLYSSLMDPEPHSFTLMTYEGSRLPPKSVSFKGFERLSTFTVQCWALQLVYFSLATVCSALQLAGVSATAVPPALANFAHVLYEVSVGTSLLTTIIVTFVLLPARIRKGDFASARRMLSWRPQLMHNANLAFATTELLLNSMPVMISHFVFAVLFGINYVLVSWWWLKRTGIIYYPFLDPTLPAPKAIALHTLLIGILGAFFAIGAGLDHLALLLPFGVRAPLLYACACSLMWTRFIRGRPGELARSEDGRDGGSE